MDTNRLKQFCVIVETGSMTSAAKLLHITHSGLSKSMKALQDELRVTLIQQAGRGISITTKGQEIYQRAKHFLQQEELFLRQEPFAAPTSFRIGTVEIFLRLIAEHLPHSQLDQTPLTLLDLKPGHIEELIAAKEIDVGVTYVPFPMQHIEMIEIGKYRLGCYHLETAFHQCPLTELPFAVPAQHLSLNPLGIRERDTWPENLFPRQKKYTVNLLSTAIELTLQGLCAIYIPHFVAKKINATRGLQSKLIEYNLPSPLQKNTQKVFLLRHSEQEDNNHIQQLITLIKRFIG